MTSMGWLTTPTTERTRDMKSSGNQMMATRNRIIRPPMPYLTIFFFFCPLGCGYFWWGDGTGQLLSATFPVPCIVQASISAPCHSAVSDPSLPLLPELPSTPHLSILKAMVLSSPRGPLKP